MKNPNIKVKLYVVLAAILILAISRFVFLFINNNFYFTPDYFVREFKAMQFKNEFDKYSLASTTDKALNTNSVNLSYEDSIPVIVYHGIPYSDLPKKFNISIENFKDQMFSLKKAGYTAITTTDLFKYLKGEITLPPKSILVTFDDGRVDSFELADPVLKALDYKATMFVIGRYSILGERKKYYLSTDQLKEMNRDGRWDIEAHSYDGHNSYYTAPNVQDGHFFSHKQWIDSQNSLETDAQFRDRIVNDFETVKNKLGELLNKPIQSFAFPYGDFGQNNTNFMRAESINIEEAKKLFFLIFYQNSPSQRFRNNYLIDSQKGDNFFLIKRIDIDPQWSGRDLLNQLDKSTTKKLPYIDNFSQDNGWLLLWGKLNMENNTLSLKTEPGQTGGTIILDGSRLWKNYSVKANVSSPNLTSVYIWVRFQDDNNNAACNFGNGFVHIEQTVNGVNSVIRGEINKNLNIPNKDFSIEARVKDREIECLINGKSIVKNSFLDPKISDGGVGFKTWDKTPELASLTINNLTIDEYTNNQ